MRRLAVLAFAALVACGGLEVPWEDATFPESPAIDGGVTLDTGSPDAWWTANLGQGQCGEGYAQKLYAPNDVAWCEGSPDAGGTPCGDANPIGWYRAGLYKCAKVTP